MAGIGTVMFGRALVLAAWGGIASVYAGYKIKRARKGITLWYDRKRNLHYDPLERWERRAKKSGSVMMLVYMWIFIAAWAAAGAWFLLRDPPAPLAPPALVITSKR